MICNKAIAHGALSTKKALSNRLLMMLSHAASGGSAPKGSVATSTISTLPKSSIFTDELPPDPEFPTPKDSHSAPRESLGPRLVRGALYTFVRPEGTKEPVLLAVSRKAMEDLGLVEGSEKEDEFRETVAGNRILTWDEEQGKGIYPWAQCYGGKGPTPRRKCLLAKASKDTNCAKLDIPHIRSMLTERQRPVGRSAWRWSKRAAK